MALNIYNTKSRSIEPFTPLKEGVVRMYACGPTVYDYPHIGNMRKYIGDDILKRTLTLPNFLNFGKLTLLLMVTPIADLGYACSRRIIS